MDKSSGTIYITKLAAAQRQLCAAIRMYFAEEEELAIHTVASAAHSILTDLKAQRGMDEAVDAFTSGIFYLILDYRRDELSKDIENDFEFMKWIRETAEILPITASSKIDEISKISISEESRKTFWQMCKTIPNFLKHADRDAKSAITLNDVDNLHRLTQAACAYRDITSDNPNECYVFWLYSNAVGGISEYMPEPDRKIASFLQTLEGVEQLNYCANLIKQLHEIDCDR